MMPKTMNFFTNVSSGIVCGIYGITICLSFTTLFLFPGTVPYSHQILACYLFGTAVVMCLTSLFSTVPVAITVPTNTSSSLLLLIIGQIVVFIQAHGSTSQLLPTIIAGFILSGVLTSISFYLLGLFGFGNLIRYIPYPVISAFMMSICWIIFEKVIALLIPLVTWNTSEMFLSALGVAFTMAIFSRYFKNGLNLILVLLASILIFYLVLFCMKIPLDTARHLGWILVFDNTISNENMIQSFEFLAHINWLALYASWHLVLVLIFMSTLSIYINLQNIEILLKKEINFNKELMVAAFANIISSFGASPIAYLSPSGIIIAKSSGGTNAIAGIVGGLCCFLVFCLGIPILSYIPKFSLFGLLLYVAATNFFSLLYNNYFQLTRLEYGTLIIIFLVICGFGFVQGLVIGVIISVCLVLINYSKINPIQYTLTGQSLVSNKLRKPTLQSILEKRGTELLYFKLQGYLFFGTAYNLFCTIKSTVTNANKIQYVILDFTLITGVDCSSIQQLSYLKQYAADNQIKIIFTGLMQSIIPIFLRNNKIIDKTLTFEFPSLDYALEWCEECMLIDIKETESENLFLNQLTLLTSSEKEAGLMLRYFQKITVEAGEYVLSQDSNPDGLYFIESGEVTVVYEHPETDYKMRLRVMGSGNIIGEMAFYSNRTRSASVFANQTCLLYYLSRESLHNMEKGSPQSSILFHKYIINIISERLVFKNKQAEELKITLNKTWD